MRQITLLKMKVIVIFAVLTSLPFAFAKKSWLDGLNDILPLCGLITEMVSLDDSPVTVKFTGRENKECHTLTAMCADALAENCEVCATVVGITDPDCSVQLKFKHGLLSKTDRTETCLERDIEPFCSASYLKINIKKTDNSLTSASFEILLTAKISADDTEPNWGAVGGVIAGLILIVAVVISIIVYCVACRKPRAGNQRQSPGSTAPLTHLSSPSYQMDESFTLQTSKGNNNTKPPN